MADCSVVTLEGEIAWFLVCTSRSDLFGLVVIPWRWPVVGRLLSDDTGKEIAWSP